MAVHTIFQKGTIGEKFVRIDQWGVAEDMILGTGSTSITVSTVGGGATIISSVVGNSVTFKTLIGGTDIVLVETANDITINSVAAGGGGGITSIVASGTGDETLIQSGAAPTAVMKMLTAGAGITLTSDGDQITIDNTAAGAVYTLADDAAATGTSLINTPAPTAEDFRLNTILGGAGIGVALVGSDVVITNTGVAQVYTLSDAAGGTGISIIAPATGGGNDFHNYQLKAGSGMSVALIGSDILLTATGGGGGAGSLTSAGGTTIIKDGTGPDFIIKGTIVSSSLELITNTNTFSFDNRCIRITDTAGAQPPTADGATASGTPSVALGVSCSATATNSVSVGIQNPTTARGVNFGRSNTLAGLDSIIFGVNNAVNAGFTRNCVFGIGCASTADTGIVIGDAASVSGVRGIAIGNAANASASEGVAVGRLSVASAASAVAYGWGATASGTESTALGRDAQSTATRSIGLGKGTRAVATDSVALGPNVRSSGTRAIVLGTSDDSATTLNSVTDTWVFGKRAGGSSTLYGTFGTSSYTRGGRWGHLTYQSITFSGVSPTQGMDPGAFLDGIVAIGLAGLDPTYTLEFPTVSDVNNSGDPWGLRSAFDGGWFLLHNVTGHAVVLSGLAGSGMSWGGTTPAASPFTKTLPASNSLVVRWVYTSTSAITLLPLGYDTISA